MRSLGVVVGSLCAWLLSAAVAVAGDDGQFPYTAYANSDDVYIRSGPGKNYYPTDKLPRGEPVEVYRHDPGGWYAIRPPRNSFS
ncbi:MAG TPA: SH3 domain-containing protein, partial [Pirellulales bacterium]|nr:SH3 domain-containing protein [Pirellulales bacterium]